MKTEFEGISKGFVKLIVMAVRLYTAHEFGSKSMGGFVIAVKEAEKANAFVSTKLVTRLS